MRHLMGIILLHQARHSISVRMGLLRRPVSMPVRGTRTMMHNGMPSGQMERLCCRMCTGRDMFLPGGPKHQRVEQVLVVPVIPIHRYRTIKRCMRFGQSVRRVLIVQVARWLIIQRFIIKFILARHCIRTVPPAAAV